jgi:hypothetical protein
MASAQSDSPRGTKWLRIAAGILVLLWGGWWTFFGAACAVSEDAGLWGTLLHASLPGLVFLVSVALVWRWEGIAGIVLIIEGAAVSVAYPILTYDRFPVATIFFVLATMALPPLIAGALLLYDWRRYKTAGAAQADA